MPCQISLNTYHNNLLKYIVNLLWFVQKENSFLCLILFSCIHFTQRIFCPWSWKLTCVGTKLWRNITKTFWFLWVFYFHDFVVSLHTCIIAFCWFFFWEALKLCKEKKYIYLCAVLRPAKIVLGVIYRRSISSVKNT